MGRVATLPLLFVEYFLLLQLSIPPRETGEHRCCTRLRETHACHDHNDSQRNCSRMAMKTCKALICWVGSSKGFHSCRLDQCLTAGLEFCQFCLLCTSLSSFRQRGWQWIWLCRAVTSPKPCFYFFGIDSSCRKSWYHDMRP